MDKIVADTDCLVPDQFDSTAWLWPQHRVLQFYTPHPVTGAPIVPETVAI